MRFGVLTISDRASAGAMEDRGGPAIVGALAFGEHEIAERAVIPDDLDQIQSVLRMWCDVQRLDVIFTTGGTGLGPRDVTPEATLAVCERPVPGIAEALRAAGMRHLPQAMLSRGVAIQRGSTLVVNLPGSPSGALEGVELLLPVLSHAVLMMGGGRH